MFQSWEWPRSRCRDVSIVGVFEWKRIVIDDKVLEECPQVTRDAVGCSWIE